MSFDRMSGLSDILKKNSDFMLILHAGEYCKYLGDDSPIHNMDWVMENNINRFDHGHVFLENIQKYNKDYDIYITSCPIGDIFLY